MQGGNSPKHCREGTLCYPSSLAALNLLVADGRLTKEYEVDCRVVGAQEALELSLAENSGREAMHPADLIMAYRNLTDAGLSPTRLPHALAYPP